MCVCVYEDFQLQNKRVYYFKCNYNIRNILYLSCIFSFEFLFGCCYLLLDGKRLINEELNRKQNKMKVCHKYTYAI